MTANIMLHDKSWFNALPSIEEASDQMIASRSLEKACETLGPILVSHDLHRTWGIGLLHNHWLLGENEVPIQHIHFDNDGSELIMEPRPYSEKIEVGPSVLGVKGRGHIVALEFSNDPVVLRANELLSECFITDFSVAAVGQHLQTTFGLTVLRDFEHDGDELVEFNNDFRRSTARRYRRGTFEGRNLLQTAWSFSPDATTLACKANCFSRCVDSGDGVHRHQDHVSLPHTKE